MWFTNHSAQNPYILSMWFIIDDTSYGSSSIWLPLVGYLSADLELLLPLYAINNRHAYYMWVLWWQFNEKPRKCLFGWVDNCLFNINYLMRMLSNCLYQCLCLLLLFDRLPLTLPRQKAGMTNDVVHIGMLSIVNILLPICLQRLY